MTNKDDLIPDGCPGRGFLCLDECTLKECSRGREHAKNIRVEEEQR